MFNKPKKRRKYLLQRVRNNTLSYEEADEIIELIKADESLDELIKTLAILGVGVLTGYYLKKDILNENVTSTKTQ